MNENENNSAAVAAPAPKGSEKAKQMTRAATRHALPFLLWIGLMFVAQGMHILPEDVPAADPTGEGAHATLDWLTKGQFYAILTVAGGIALLVTRPWKFYAPLQRKNILPALLVGLAVLFVWVFPQSDCFRALCPSLADLYETWCVTPFGSIREVATLPDGSLPAPYAPSATGWPLFLVHLVGTGVVIAAAEEFFWRGYLQRKVRTPDFLDVDIGALHWPSFLAVAAIFALEHHEAVAGLVAGVAYGLLYIRTRDIWAAIIAHGTTNLLLGFYVLATGHWNFW